MDIILKIQILNKDIALKYEKYCYCPNIKSTYDE